MNYNKMVLDVRENGLIRDSRLGISSEIIGFQVEFETGLLFYRPKMQRRLGWVESLQMLAGVFYPSDFRLAAPGLMWEYTVDSGYGTKLGDQIFLAIDQLKKQPLSRRAIVFIDSAGYAGERLRPCVSSYQFLIAADGKLYTVMSVRSWDLVSGFLYDTMAAGMISLAVADQLQIKTGGTIANAGSGHVYHKDIEEGRINPLKDKLSKMTFNTHFDSWEILQRAAVEELRRFRSEPAGFQSPWFVDVKELD